VEPGYACPAPLPCPPLDPSLPIYAIADGQFLVDGTGGAVAVNTRLSATSSTIAGALAAQADAVVNLINQVQDAQFNREFAMAFGLDAETDSPETFSPLFAEFDTNGLWLEITNVSNGWAYLNLHNATNQVYAIWSTTNLLTSWQVETEVWPTNGAVMPFTVPTLNRQNLFLKAQDWTGVYSNGLPCWWTWYYFHTLNLNATNSDGQWDTLGYDYTNHVDPNVINFTIAVTNTDVNTAHPNLPLNLISGIPAYVAVLVNDGNLADAVWQSYTGSNAVAVLGADGGYTVSVGLRGFPTNATETWEVVDLTKNTVPPRLTITGPTNNTVSQMPIQFQGYANQPLTAVTFDLSNANGTVSGQPCFLTGQFYDTTLMAYTTNYFQSDDIYLAGGTNIVTLHATDWAGNQTNVSLTLNYPAGLNAPMVSFLWPATGAVVSGDTLTLQMQVNNPAATVSATSGSTTIQGMVERSGTAWVHNLPLVPGANNITITASDANGHITTTNLTVTDNNVGLGIDALTSDQLNQPTVNVYGEIGSPSVSLVVNGITAHNHGDGTWDAGGVPVSPTGTAIIGVQVFSNAVNVASQFLDQVQPVMVALMSYSAHQTLIDTTPLPYTQAPYSDGLNWCYKTGGSIIDSYPFRSGIPAGTNGLDYLELYTSLDNATPIFSLPWEFASLSVLITNDHNLFQSQSQPKVMIVPGGQAQPGTTNLYLVMARACEFSDANIQGGWPAYGVGYLYSYDQFGNNINSDLPYGGDMGLPPEWLQVNGKTLANTGITNVLSSPYGGPSIRSVWGATIVAAPAGQNWEITAAATNVFHHWDYTFNEQASNLNVKIFAITNGTAIDLSSNVPEFCVGQQVVFSNSFSPPLPAGIPVSYQWNLQGEHVNQITNLNMLGESPIYTNNPALATNSVTSLWWYNGGSNIQVSCTFTIGGESAMAQGHVNIYRPTLTGFTNQSPRSFIADMNDDILSYGDRQTGDSNMTWIVNINSKYDGRKGVTQIITADWWVEPVPGQISYHGCADAAEFYEHPDLVTNNVSVVGLDDAPSITIGSYSGEILFTNTLDYIRFKPGRSENDGNIYVTLGIVRWSAHGRYNNLTSTMTDNYTPAATPPDGSDGFPRWGCIKEEQ
jgi:hypothetical protein